MGGYGLPTAHTYQQTLIWGRRVDVYTYFAPCRIYIGMLRMHAVTPTYLSIGVCVCA